MAHLTGDEKRRYVAEMFARISPRYDLMNSLMTGGLHHRWKRATARTTAGSAAGAALDVASGTGDLAFALADCSNVTEVVGVDLLSEMLTIANRRRARNSGGGQNIQFVQGDALQLPFPDDAFIGATAGFSLRNMPDVPSAIREMARVVTPGGRVTTLELTPMPPGIVSGMGRFYFHRLVPLMGQLIAGDRTAYTYLPDSVDYFLTADGLADVFRQAGLVGVGYRHLGLGGVALHFGDKPA
jgi:demethylmenaquinone methyltransferase/2-methoxy-6-polyprenyl-1,4-benzoquinol methylase